MKKRLLSIITSVSLLSSAFSFGVSAVPSAVDTVDAGIEYVPDVFLEEKFDSELSVEGPSAVDIIDTAEETNTEFGTPELYDGAVLFSELSGEGTKESPYLIGTADELKLMANNINTGIGTEAYYKMTADIDLGGAEWTPAGFVTGSSPYTDYSHAFKGNFDGDGHTVSNYKITAANTAYIGFFGFIYDGTVENLTLDDMAINVNSKAENTLYVGGVAGRVIANSKNARSNIINCHIKNSSISATNASKVYAGGIIGTGIAGAYDGAHIFVGFSTAECDMDIYINAKATGQFAVAGGIVGIYGSLTGSKITAINCHASGDIYVNSLSSYYSNALAGGAFGSLQSYETGQEGGAINIDSCYSEGTVVAESDFMPYTAGGFIAQFLPTANSYISNCYSSSDASGRHLQKGNSLYPNNDPVVGGFVGMLEFNGFTNAMSKKITNCYAQGDAIDLTHTEADAKDTSFVGAFAGYSTAGTFGNCYKLATQKVWGSDIFYDDITTLTEEDLKYHDKYEGFDFVNTWNFDADSDYPYPTLQEKIGFVDFIVDDASYAMAVFGKDGRVSKPAVDPKKADTVDKTFTFNYWSLSEDGTAFNFGADTLSKNTNLYAVFSSAVRKYNVFFISEGTDYIPSQKIDYGSQVSVPEGIPEKEDNETYFYEFLYWSLEADGKPADFIDFTVMGDHTFYAVFKEIDKSAWRGEIAESFSSGFGTENAPYIIRTSEEFALLATVINEQREGYVDAYYALGNDVNLGENIWIPVGRNEDCPFSGKFDGRGYTIHNFTLTDGKYSGIFGYALNATFKNVHVSNFKITLSTQKDMDETYNMYSGALVGYLTAKDGFTSSVSNVRVSDFEVDINVNISNLYLGAVAGFSIAEAKSTVTITDSFATGEFTAVNTGGYNYLGGITGMGEMKSKSTYLISRCYFYGSLTTNSYRTSHAAGVVGYLKSSGSAYLPDVGTTSSDDSSLAVEDYDIMASDCFAVASVKSETTAPFSRSAIGYVVGEVNQYAAVENLAYPVNANISVKPADSNIGKGTLHANLKNEEHLSTNFGFDFENTWIFVPESAYPVLRCMVATKPALRIMKANLNEGTLDVSVQVILPETEYTLIVSVYNARNQLIKAERITPEIKDAALFEKSYENMDRAVKVSVSAVDKYSLKPLFEGVSTSLIESEI